MVHRAQTRRATPPWADLEAIEKFYEEARHKTAETGELHVVDHIVPKIGKIVCGLHVHWNLRVIHWLENSRKGAWEWPGMPMEQLTLIN
jgi:5-methylcytosine-specific restriction endonuclease McrA